MPSLLSSLVSRPSTSHHSRRPRRSVQIVGRLVRIAGAVAVSTVVSTVVCVAQAPRWRCGMAEPRTPRQAGVEDTSIYVACAVDRTAQLHSGRLPDYPKILQQANVSGHVVLSLVIGTDGKVEPRSLGVYKSTHDLFTAASKAAVLTWTAVPALIGRAPVRQRMKFAFDFRLDCSKSVVNPDRNEAEVCPKN